MIFLFECCRKTSLVWRQLCPETASRSEQCTNNKCLSRVHICKQSSFHPVQMSNWKLKRVTDPPLKPKQGCQICLRMLTFSLPSECQQLVKARYQQEPGVLITTEWNSGNQKQCHSACYWTKGIWKTLDALISFLHESRWISLTSLTHSERNYHSRLVPRCVQSLKWLRWWDSGEGAGDQWGVCVRARCSCAPPPPPSRMWLKSEAEQRRADRFIMKKWNCSDNDDNCGGPSEGGRTAPGGHWGCITRSLIDGREMMCVSGGVKNDSGFCVSRESTEQAKSWTHEHH